MRFCLIFGAVLRELILSCGIAVLQNQVICGIRKFRVISMGFAVFLCYSVRCLYVFLCVFAIFVPPPPSPPLHNLVFSKMLWHQRCFPVQFEQSLQTRCIKAVSVKPDILFFLFLQNEN